MADDTDVFSEGEIAELKKVFFAQAHELIDELQDALLKLETDSGDAETLKTIKRYVHTLKGDSNSIGLVSVGTLCHRVEDVLSSLADGLFESEHAALDLLMNCADAIQKLLVEAESGREHGDIEEIEGKIGAFLARYKQEGYGPGKGPHTEYQALELADALKSGLLVYDIEIVLHPECREKGVAALMVSRKLGAIGKIIRSTPEVNSAAMDRAAKLDLLFSTSLGEDEVRHEALVPGISKEIHIKNYAPPEKRQYQGAAAGDTGPRKQEMKSDLLRVEVSRVDKIMNLVGELIIGRSMIDQVTRELEGGAVANDVLTKLSSINSYFERTLTELQNGVMKMRMVPVNHVFRKFPKTVRDLSLEEGKRVRLDIQGRDAELDKGIVDALGEPLAHIIRNMIGHGIETPDARAAAGKPEEGTIILRAYHEAAHIVIEASDDGRGIDRDALRKKAIEDGFLAAEEAPRLLDADVLNLIFISGLSTSGRVSELSGRGVGMDAVKSAVQGMKGTIEVESTPGKGTKFKLTLPLTLAVIKALLFEVGGRLFAVPVAAVSEVLRVMDDELRTVDGKTTLTLRDQIISMIRLSEVFGTEGSGAGKKFALLFGSGHRKAGLIVDRLVGQQELVIKAVDDRHAQTAMVTGASILGDGRVILILDAPAIYRKAVEMEKEKIVKDAA